LKRKYIDRKTKEHFKRLTRFDDDSKFVTESGPKIVEFDEAIKVTRSLYLKDIVNQPLDIDDVLIMKIMELVNTAKETRDYIEQTNQHLYDQWTRVEELKKGHKVFENQVHQLGSVENETDPE
jgi:hypothetical protein